MHEFDNELETFKSSIFQLESYQSFTKTIEQQRHGYRKQLEDHGVLKKESELSSNDWQKSLNLFYKDYCNGQLLLLDHKEFNLDDFYSFEMEIKNRQYQFILLHAFEAFEKYLKKAAVVMEYPLNKFDSITFIKKTHVKIPVLKQIIEVRSQHDKFLNEVNLLLTFSVIEQLRHQITHASGYAKNKAAFIKKCLDRIGIYNNGHPKPEYIELINIYFGNGKRADEVCLIEIRDQNKLHFSHDRLDHLIRELLSYIVFIHPHIRGVAR